MKTNESFIQDLKLNLMDVVLNDHSYNRTEQVKQLLKEIEKAPFIEQVDIAVQSTNVVSKSLKIYSLHQRQLMSDEDLATYLNNEDRKSTRLNSSHVSISYAVFCLKKKTNHS